MDAAQNWDSLASCGQALNLARRIHSYVPMEKVSACLTCVDFSRPVFLCQYVHRYFFDLLIKHLTRPLLKTRTLMTDTHTSYI